MKRLLLLLLLFCAQAWATSPVQSSGAQRETAGGTAVTFNAGSNFAVGSTVVITWAWTGTAGNSPTSIVIAGTTATFDMTGAPGSVHRYGIARAVIANASRTDVVFNMPAGANNSIRCSFEEWASGVFDASPVDVQVEASATATTVTGTTATTTQANALVYVAGWGSDGGGNWNTPATTTGYTETYQDDTSPEPFATGAYKEVSATGAQSATLTSASSDPKRVIVQTYKITPSGGGATPKKLTTLGAG
jgi:hypothetical protein